MKGTWKASSWACRLVQWPCISLCMCSAEPRSEADSCCLCLSKFATCCSNVATWDKPLYIDSLLTSQASAVGILYSARCCTMHVGVGRSCLLRCHAVIVHDAAIAGICLCCTARYAHLPHYTMGRDQQQPSRQQRVLTAVKQDTSNACNRKL